MPGGALLLAAGASRRFGSDKRTHRMQSGESVLHATTAKYLNCFEHVVVVLKPGDAHLETALADRFENRSPRVVVAASAALGMGHSLAAGIAAIGDWDYVFVALGDMPFVAQATLIELKQAMHAADPGGIVQPTLHGIPGHPVGFDRGQFAELRTLTGDAGARSVVKAHADQVVTVEVSDNGVLRDIDQPVDLDP